jgi:hypothetical protein
VIPSSTSVCCTESLKPDRSSATFKASVLMTWRLAPDERRASIQHVNRQQHDEREDEQSGGEKMGLRVFEGLDVLVDGDRDDLRATRYVAADHEHDAELAERVRELEKKLAKPRRSRS